MLVAATAMDAFVRRRSLVRVVNGRDTAQLNANVATGRAITKESAVIPVAGQRESSNSCLSATSTSRISWMV
jgi:hypothetical protein